jgi:hypothetical protein
MRDFKERFGPWAVVTGASSGIGKDFARRLAEKGLNLVLVARREDRLRQLADQLRSRHAVDVRIVAADLVLTDFLRPIEEATRDVQVGLLVNNAGIATVGNLLDNDLEAELALLQVNVRAPLILAHHFGNSMRQRGRGGIIFVASTLAFAAVPGWGNYAASKAYALALAEALAKELASAGVSVMALCPGATRTELWAPGAKPFMAMEPRSVVEIALKKLGKRTTVVAGFANWITTVSTRLLPRSWNAAIFDRVVGGMLKGAEMPANQTTKRSTP